MKAVLGIFAHPDDEALGPGGTIATFAKDHDVYLICATNGDGALGNRKKEIALGKLRREELLASAKVLGVKKVFFLGYQDGSLSHNVYHKIADEILTLAKKIKPEILLTFEPLGVSGHIDHIVMSMITSFVFPQIRSAKKLMKYCLTFKRSQLMQGKYFIYFPPGYSENEIDESVDTKEVWDTKISAMKQHKSQIKDVHRVISQSKNFPKKENFLVISKEE